MYRIIYIDHGERYIAEVNAPTMRAARVIFRENYYASRDVPILSIRRVA